MGSGGQTMGECFYCGRATGDTSGHATCNRIGPAIIAAERERVRAAIQQMLGGLTKAYDRDILETLAEDLGIDIDLRAKEGAE